MKWEREFGPWQKDSTPVDVAVWKDRVYLLDRAHRDRLELWDPLEGGRTVIYTFTYNPAGDGPAWFIGVGNVAGNSLVTEDMLRPEGTSWGDAFDTTDINFADWGGMSMVFPACAMGDAPGNVAFSGNEDGGFEPLITVAERLTDVLGCGPATDPHPNAGLSGSFLRLHPGLTNRIPVDCGTHTGRGDPGCDNLADTKRGISGPRVRSLSVHPIYSQGSPSLHDSGRYLAATRFRETGDLPTF